MPRKVVKLTNERNKTHGDFENVAFASQKVMAIYHASPNWATLSDARKESILLIAHKLGRIVSGNPDHHDHWDDIGGYAELGKNDGQRPKPVTAARMPRRPAKVKAKVRVRPAKKTKKLTARRPVARARRAARPVTVHLKSRRSGKDLRTVVTTAQQAAE